MTIDEAHFLLSPEGRDLLTQADALRAVRTETLAALTRLRRAATPSHAAHAWEISDLRQRGAAKFGPMASQMLFTREALEQASSARASGYHAARFVQAGVTAVSDLCGGIGGDALAFAGSGLQVTLYERDPVRALFARANAAVHGRGEQITVVEADVTAAALETGAAWFDPARRQDGRRVAGPDDCTPPLSFLRDLEACGVMDVGVKLSPAIDHGLAAEYGAGLEFLSDGGECKEALLWRGRLRTGDAVRATKLTEAGPISLVGTPDDREALAGPTGRFLYEPDPAAIRAHLIQTLAARIGAVLVHPQIAYLIGGEYRATPWAAAYEVLDRFPYSRRRLQEALRERGVGRVIIKKRGFPQEPDDVRRQLKLSGPHEMTVVLTRAAREGTHQAFLCHPVQEIGGVLSNSIGRDTDS